MSDFLAIKQVATPPFNWTDDSCAGDVPDVFAADPCKRHDFGYRNYGQGIQLQRDENTRKWIDNIPFENITRRVFFKPVFFGVKTECTVQALAFDGAVRANPGENWDAPLQ